MVKSKNTNKYPATEKNRPKIKIPKPVLKPIVKTKFSENLFVLEKEQGNYLEQLNDILDISDLDPNLRLKCLKDREAARVNLLMLYKNNPKLDVPKLG